MHFTVERRLDSAWKLVEEAIEAVGPSQAVARAATDAGIYRARPIGTSGLEQHFVVPAWGPPQPIVPGPVSEF